MNIIFLTKRKKRPSHVQFHGSGLLALVVSVFVVLPAAAIFVGYHLGQHRAEGPAAFGTAIWKEELAEQRNHVDSELERTRENLNALALRLSQLQARVIRLDALGQRLVRVADLDRGEFDFENPPAQGGPAEIGEQQVVAVPDFVEQLESLDTLLDDRERQLRVLEAMLMNRSVQEVVRPAGYPVESGWISSYFGTRTDPFTGQQAQHDGVDFAGKSEANIIAVAAGVVSYAGERYGYGTVVEINHGNGYVTRYAHNAENLVEVGDTVQKGQVIALMGSSGRSTGPHVHFEVLYNGKVVNPAKYIQAAR